MDVLEIYLVYFQDAFVIPQNFKCLHDFYLKISNWVLIFYCTAFLGEHWLPVLALVLR